MIRSGKRAPKAALGPVAALSDILPLASVSATTSPVALTIELILEAT